MALNIDHLNEIDRVNFHTERVTKRIREFRAGKPTIMGDRAFFLAKSWQETENEPIPVRRAKGFAKLVDGIPVVIREGELIVGSQAKEVLGCYPFPEWDAELCLKEFSEKASFSKEKDFFEAETPELERERILESARFWKGKSVVEKTWDRIDRLWGSRMKDLYDARVFYKPFNRPPGADRSISIVC